MFVTLVIFLEQSVGQIVGLFGPLEGSFRYNVTALVFDFGIFLPQQSCVDSSIEFAHLQPLKPPGNVFGKVKDRGMSYKIGVEKIGVQT